MRAVFCHFALSRLRQFGVAAAVCLAPASIALPPLAHAAKPPTATAEAESIAETAARRYKLGEYELAAQLYDRAWELAKRPALLFNAGRAWERAGKLRAALQRYQACAAVETEAGAREEARLRAARLNEQLANDERKSDSGLPAPVPSAAALPPPLAPKPPPQSPPPRLATPEPARLPAPAASRKPEGCFVRCLSYLREAVSM